MGHPPDPDGHCWKWAQGICNFFQRPFNALFGNGFNTRAEVLQYRRDWLSEHVKTQQGNEEINWSKISDSDVDNLYKKGHNHLDYLISIAFPFLDATGKVHGELPDHVPDNWSREQMEEAAENLKQSIKRRSEEQIQLGEEGGHRARIDDERDLLRQIEKKLSGS